MINWIKRNKFEFLIILIILAIASFLRFYKLSEYMTFLGDEGRDALMIKRILIDHDFPLLGPPTSVGDIYLGPIYYYLMAGAMGIFWMNPAAASGMVALFGVATVGLIYYLARIWFGKIPAITAAILYAVSPITIIYSRSSWNPNPAPFFALLAILGFFKAHQSKNFMWLALTGLALGFIVQMHYLAFILLPTVFILWLFEWKNRQNIRNFFIGTFWSIVVFLILLLPLFIFDFKYNFMNYRALLAFFTSQNSAVSFNPLLAFINVWPIYLDKLILRYIAGQNLLLAVPVAIIAIVPFIYLFKKKIAQGSSWPYFALFIWLFVGLAGLSLYRMEIYDHYLGFLNPVPYLLLGGFLALIPKKWVFPTAVFLVIIFGFFNLRKNILFSSPGDQLKRTQNISKFVIAESRGKPFNFALIAKQNYDAAYQFYLDQYGFPPKVVPVEKTDQLFVVCEDVICQPVVNSKYEIAAFGMSKIAKENIVEGIKVYKLVSNPTGKPS